MRVTSHRETSRCPLCSTPSSAVHSSYRRHPLDLPCTGRPIRLLLTCRAVSCPRKIFTERLPELIEASSRLTKRLRTTVQEIGFATCGKGGERLARKLGIPLSDAALLWSLFLAPLPSLGKAQVIGIDDWSWRRGQRYGSIIVDLRTHKIIDLLPERSVEAVIAWFETHPDVEVVSRDRGSTYVDGVTRGAPCATQVCDRWHLIKNLGDAVLDFLIRAHIRVPAEPLPKPPEVREQAQPPACVASASRTQREEASQARLSKHQDVCRQAKDLHEQGWSIHSMSKHLGRERTTIRKYLKIEGDWHPTPRQSRPSKLDPYSEYILLRWEQGCQNGQRILREIRAQGYQGCDTLLRDVISRLRKNLPVKAHPSAQASSPIRAIPKTPRELRWLLAKHREDLACEEQTVLDRVLESSEEVRVVHRLLHSLLQIVRNRKHEQLGQWIAGALSSGIPELKSFIVGIERDYEAVKAALRLPWRKADHRGKSQ